jgi:hypothetical protein
LFIADSTALADAQSSLEVAKGKVDALLVRYQFMEKLVKEWRGRPKILKTFKEKAVDKKWVYGKVSSDARVPPEYRVSLTDGTKAYQVVLECKNRPRATLHFRRMRVEISGEAEGPEDQDPLTVMMFRPSFYIVGWTLSCRTKKPRERTFVVKRGGILEDELMIDVKAVIGMFASDVVDWRCRIFFVDSADYEFPRLILSPDSD